MNRPRLYFTWMIPLLIGAAGTAPAAQPVDYERQIKPILKQRCYSCHGALKQKAHLRLDTGALIRKGGDAGQVIEPGHADGSPLLERLRESDTTRRMPPEGPPLTAEQISIVQAWVEQGAQSPADEAPETDPLKHWSFQPTIRPILSTAASSSNSRSPIDELLKSSQQKASIKPLDRAEPNVLLRRVYLDLTGLPPTRDELHQFLNDPSDEAYEKVVDRLLASPQHGERWARHWMDVWRYSDWYGRRAVPDVLNSYGQIWRWRDWIVRSLNDDRGYDSMVHAMLAADELKPDDPSEVVATGFLVRNFYRWNYNSWMKDNVEHTGKAFLGLTFNCAHCHDHKYDPIKQEDYFALRAIFDPIDLRHDRVPNEPDPGPYTDYEYGKSYGPIKSGLVRVYDRRLDVRTFLYTRGESRNIVSGRPPIQPGVPAFLTAAAFHLEPVILPPDIAYPGLQVSLRREEIASREANLAKADQTLAKTRTEVAKLKNKSPKDAAIELKLKAEEAARSLALADLATLDARIAADDAKRNEPGAKSEALKLLAAHAEKWLEVQKAALAVAQSELALKAAEAKSTTEAKKAETKLAAARKAYDLALVALKADTSEYTALSPTYPSKSTGRRTALARWITDRANPLTARVAVNHIWRWHFGTPLVATTQDFGRNGAHPSHPQLLDWLAVELMEPNTPVARPWSMKSIHRLIVTSNAYKRKCHPADPRHPGFKIDPTNLSYWHFPVRRMEAEEIRDSLLHVAGTLDTTLGGPDIDITQGLTSRRRSLYFSHHGDAKMPFLETFDAPDACDAYRRTTSVVPQQALALVNNDFLLELSQTLSEKLRGETATHPADPETSIDRFVTAGFETVLSRTPTTAERDLAARFLAEQASIIRGESPSLPTKQPQTPETKAQRDFLHALFNHNDFLTIH